MSIIIYQYLNRKLVYVVVRIVGILARRYNPSAITKEDVN